MNFEFRSPKTIISRSGCSSETNTFENLKLKGPILLVTDATLVKIGLVSKLSEALEHCGHEIFLFEDVEPEPNISTVRKALEFCKNKAIATVLGMGGGSPMDIAKIISVLLKSPQSIEAMYGVDNVQGERLPLLLIPTTAGTGSEATHVAVVTGDDGEKSPIVDPKLICDVVVLDAALSLGLPPKITAATGVDAMVHALEAYTSGFRKNVISDQLALHAFKLLYTNIHAAVHNGSDVTTRSQMLLGSTLAGLAFANATVGAVHALSYPLGTQFKLPHGESNALVLIPVMRFNAKMAFPLYAELCREVHPELSLGSDESASEYLLDQLEDLLPKLGLKNRLSEYGIKEKDLDSLVEGTLKQERLLAYNYSKMEKQDILGVFKNIL